MKYLFSLVVMLIMFSFAAADEPLFMTRAEIKAYVDQQIDAKIANVVDVAVEKAFARHNTIANGYVQNANGSWSCPAGVGCPAGCVMNTDGTCSCPAGTACGLSASQFGVTYQSPRVTYTYTSDDPSDDSGDADNGATGKRKRFHLLGRPHVR